MRGSRLWLTFLLLIGVASRVATSGALPARPAPSGTPNPTSSSLISTEPTTLHDLEAIVGPLHRDPSVWKQAVGPLDRRDPSPGVLRVRVAFAIDIFHFDPQKETDPALDSYEIDFPSGRAAALAALEAKLGPARSLLRDGRRAMRYGEHFFVQGKAGSDALTLLWFSEEPEFAIPRRSGAETAALAADVASILRAGLKRSVVEAHFGKLVHDPGQGRDVARGSTWELGFAPAGSESPDEVWIDFKRPIPAAGILPVLHVAVPRVTAYGTHLGSRTLIDLRDPHYGRIGIAGYQVDVELDRSTLVKTKESLSRPGLGTVWRGAPLSIVSLRAERPTL